VQTIAVSLLMLVASAQAAAPEPRSVLLGREPVAVRALRDAGDDTAVAAVESFLHAAVHGKATAVSEMIRWTWRENAHRTFGDLPGPWAEKAGSPEKLIGLAEVRAFARVERVQVIAQIVVSANEEIVGLRVTGADNFAAEHLFWMRWAGSRWLRVEPSTLVARLARQVAAGGVPDTTDPLPFREQYAWIVPQTGPKPVLRDP
jgi:hypothetical protein